PPDSESKGTNYFRTYSRPVDFGAVAALAAKTLRDVFQTPFPARLEYEAFERGGKEILIPTLQITRRREEPQKEKAAKTETVGSIRAKLLKAMKEASGHPDLGLDKDREIAVRFGSAIVFVRVHDKPPYVSVFSPLLSKFQANEKIVHRMNEMNRSIRFARLF